MLTKKKVTRTERGWAGHFCASSNCRFRRNTLLQCGGRRIVVSTVGNYWPRPLPGEPMPKKPDEIGCDCYYETMAFRAEKIGEYWEARMSKQVNFESQWSIEHADDGADAEANDMHEAVVAELTKRLEGK